MLIKLQNQTPKKSKNKVKQMKSKKQLQKIANQH